MDDTPKNYEAPNAIPYPTTWVDGRIIFKEDKKWSMFFYGICSYTGCVFAVTPFDYERPLMITTINVSYLEKYCERAFSCMHFGCALNQWDKGIYLDEFKDCGAFSLSLPNNIGSKPLWFNEGNWRSTWVSFVIPVDGGTLKYNENREK